MFLQVLPPRDRADDDEEIMDVGLLGVGGQRDVEFALLNPNPVEVGLDSWGVEPHSGEQLVKVWVELLGVGFGSKQDVLQRWEQPSSNLTQTVSFQS